MKPAHASASEADTDDELPLPCPQALIAATLALMTTWADPVPGSALDVASLRSLLARKVVSNLYLLAEHPALSAPMRQVMLQARERWLGLTRVVDAGRPTGCPAPAGLPPGTLWH